MKKKPKKVKLTHLGLTNPLGITVHACSDLKSGFEYVFEADKADDETCCSYDMFKVTCAACFSSLSNMTFKKGIYYNA